MIKTLLCPICHKGLCVDYSRPHEMEDDLIFFKDARRTQFFLLKWKTASFFSKIEDNLNILEKLEMEDNHNL
jgi:hypothetical protein